jgi:hypothetical protein
MGRTGEHLQLTIEDELGHTHHSTWWQAAGFSLPETSFDLAYAVRSSNYRGQRGVQIEWVDYRLVESQKISISTEKHPIEVIDFRKEFEPINKLAQIQETEQLIIWGEACPPSTISCQDRYTISPSDTLAILTIPPGYNELQEVLRKVKPDKVYLFGINPGMDDPEAFLRRLLGLLKYQIKSSNGVTSLSSLAAAAAQKNSTIKIGLEWLEAHSHIHIVSIDGDVVRVEVSTITSKKVGNTSPSPLNSSLTESAAFRRYYLNADKDRLILYE